jgi:secondary thiamine-phosphate synthase enzyme
MVFFSESITVSSPGRGTTELTDMVQAQVKQSGVHEGLCTVFVHHTSASLMICENADPQVREDLERFFARLVKDGDPVFHHIDEGPDDMPSHVRSILTQPSISIPIRNGRCDLGTWQGIYLWEHRFASHHRKCTVSVVGSTC